MYALRTLFSTELSIHSTKKWSVLCSMCYCLYMYSNLMYLTTGSVVLTKVLKVAHIHRQLQGSAAYLVPKRLSWIATIYLHSSEKIQK